MVPSYWLEGAKLYSWLPCRHSFRRPAGGSPLPPSPPYQKEKERTSFISRRRHGCREHYLWEKKSRLLCSSENSSISNRHGQPARVALVPGEKYRTFFFYFLPWVQSSISPTLLKNKIKYLHAFHHPFWHADPGVGIGLCHGQKGSDQVICGKGKVRTFICLLFFLKKIKMPVFLPCSQIPRPRLPPPLPRHLRPPPPLQRPPPAGKGLFNS